MQYVTVRYFAAAAAAAGVKEEVVDLSSGATVGDLLERLQYLGGDPLSKVLRCSSLLLDGLAVHDVLTTVAPGSIIDVLPPFAGG